jgi:PQQ-dependent catabolism-associated CXXCW motif protein
MKERTIALLLAASITGQIAPPWVTPVRAQAEWEPAIEEPEGYRMEDYNAPVPETLRGAQVATTQEAEALWRSGKAVFLDVMPRTPKPADLPAGTIWRDKPRRDIPGSLWLVNVGYGALPPETTAYFREALARVSDGTKDRPLLFYCMADCWMSWNAAKRAVGWGYTSVLWYPLGADGWEKAGLPLKENSPYAINN